MKASEILRNAARLIENESERWGCASLIRAIGEDPYDEKYIHTNSSGENRYEWDDDAPSNAMAYFKLMRPSRVHNPDEGWFGGAFTTGSVDRRVLALCFAAAIAESEGN